MQLGSRAVVCALATLFLYGTVGAVDLIWLSPTNLNYSSPYYLENYDAEIGVWSTIDVGTGSRGSAPFSLMDSKGIIWIMFGSQLRWEESFLYSVWNYNPKTDKYRYVWGSNETAVNMNPRNPGDLRVANGTNHPGYVAFEGATLDKDDNIWFTTYEVSGELWMFNTTSMVFVRMFGLSSETNAPSVGANPGIPAEDVWPGKVEGECLVTDSQNNIWQISGYNNNGVTNAVWMFNTTSYLWTFVYGDVNQQWITHNATFFGGVWMPGCFIDENDKVWLFGGWGASETQNHNDYASIWTFDTRDTREYKLEYGENTFEQLPQVVSDDFHADNHPGGCEGPIFVDRKDGTLMAVIGSGYASNGNFGGTDQIWLYNVTVKQWKLVHGNISAVGGEGAFTHYRQPGSQFPGTMFFGQFSGKNTNGDVYIVNGDTSDGYQHSRKDIWLVPQDQCSFSTANDCDVNAICTEEMFGYSCACKEGYTGDGTTCTSVPVATPTTESSPTAGSTPSKQQTSSASIIGLSFIVACIVISIVF